MWIQRHTRTIGEKLRGCEWIHRIRTSLTPETGVSLVEVLMAAIVLGIAVVAISYMFGTAGADIGKLGNQRVALQVAQDEMESLLSLPYDDPLLDGTAGDQYRRFERPPNTDVTSLTGSLLVRWSVADIDESANGVGNDYKRIILELYDDLLDDDVWATGTLPAFKPAERVVTLTTLIAP